MSLDPADLALIKYLEGEPAVIRAAEVLCNAAARLTRAQKVLTNATSAFTTALADAGVREEDRAQVACSFVFLNHRSCHSPHSSGANGKGRHHSER